MKYILPILVLTSCAITSKYNPTEKLYFRLLTEQEKEHIQQQGDTFKSFELANSRTNEIETHNLRITYDDQKSRYVFVRIGSYIYNFFSPSDVPFVEGKYHIDSISVDDYGNVTYRAHYERKKSDTEYYLEQRWTSKSTDNNFLQHYTTYTPNGNKVWEGSASVKDFKEIKFYQNKNIVKFGKEIYYDKRGNIKKIKIYDNNGELIKEEKYSG